MAAPRRSRRWRELEFDALLLEVKQTIHRLRSPGRALYSALDSSCTKLYVTGSETRGFGVRDARPRAGRPIGRVGASASTLARDPRVMRAVTVSHTKKR